MPDPARLRDSTQIVLPCAVLNGVRSEIERKFTVTIYSRDGEEMCKIIASPVEIKQVADFLTRHGISVQ
jgi:hypothetical protein